MLRRLRRPWALGTGALVVAVAATGLWWFVLRDRADADAPSSTTQTVAASLSTLEKSVTGSGTIAPTVEEDVSFAVSGTVLSVDVAEGDTVAAGQTLATVDTLRLNAALLSAKADLATAAAKLADLKDADDGSDVADAQIAAASAQVDVAQAAADAAEQDMADATLVAPVAGLLTTVDLAVGDAVTGSGSSGGGSTPGGSTSSTGSGGGSTSTAQFVIVGTDSWQTEISVDDSDVALIAVGNQVEMAVDGASGTVFGTVAEIGLLSASTSGVAAYPVTIQVTGSPDGVHDGVSVEASIVYERRTDVLTVPSTAVHSATDGSSYVLQTGDDGAQVQTAVTVGETNGSLTEITSGLAEGDEVLVTVVSQTGQSGTGGQDQRQGQFPTDMGSFDPSQMGGGFPGGGQMPGQQSNG